ncbi:metallophosphoesterase [Streptomyces beihaiensis]|uniref:Bifunctional metallophosphatase/5'-nucleotidase n=1 Tax=Streptomyces beihaiensis TaxID=2984495 RepID=A0ABT3U4Z2_9ACTN|nr:metallophosphoesterase [Streptomyces beihaiensis]MCX3063721.1 bifunctional metallophosphatase/5'-nucleotidase [Streptomyces beihaiensis]
MTTDGWNLRQIVATTDVHSAFDNAAPFLTHLHALRPTSLIVDCGDFFEGSGYYRLARGTIEREILLGLYDVLAPGNHGWPHHFEPALHRRTVCANAVDANTGDALFRRLHIADIDGRRVGVTAVIGRQAFHSIPAAQRVGHCVTDPLQALREVILAHHEVDSWVLLSHSGFEEDRELAAACPFLDVVFAGHCHSDQYGPVRIDGTLVVKGRELAGGYAIAMPVGTGWGAGTASFPDRAPSVVPTEIADLRSRIEDVKQQLADVLGPISPAYRHQALDRRSLLLDLTARLRTGLGADAVILNETALRAVPLGGNLTQGDLLSIEPFGNQLVHAHVPDPVRGDLPGLISALTPQTGPLVTAPDPFPDAVTTVLTTDYLADTYLGERTHEAGLRLDQAVRHVLTAPDTAEGGR